VLSALRKEMQQLLAVTPSSRKPALRRSDAPGALLATDLPLLAEEDDLSAFVAVVMAHGWQVDFAPNGWLLLDHEVPVPEASASVIPAGEAGCCLSLLLRHPGGEKDAVRIRALVKAADASWRDVEKLCRIWHRDFAAMLRMKQPLPDLAPWLGEAVNRYCAKEDQA
jgi:hypothetical protein